MAKKTSEFSKVVLKIIKEGEALRAAAAKSSAIPLMQEKLSRRDALTRMRHMTPQDLAGMRPEERETLLKELGTGPVVDIFRRQR